MNFLLEISKAARVPRQHREPFFRMSLKAVLNLGEHRIDTADHRRRFASHAHLHGVLLRAGRWFSFQRCTGD
jgi:hypothetical protein